MCNNFVLVGRLVTDIEEIGEKHIILNLSISKTIEEGQDVLPISLYGNIAEATLENCKKGCIVGVKGYIKNEDGIELVADKVTFLSTAKKEEKKGE